MLSFYRKNLSVDEIHDIHGLRLIVESEADCYKALSVVHQLWSVVPGKLKDYINHPKFNGYVTAEKHRDLLIYFVLCTLLFFNVYIKFGRYQSLHTVVVGEGMVPLEVQIRTKEMHLQAEFGFAAHWRYKEGDCKHSSFVLQMVEWARWVVTWQCEAMSKDGSAVGYSNSVKPPCTFPSHSDDCPFSYKPDCSNEGPVFVILIENDKVQFQDTFSIFSCLSLLRSLVVTVLIIRWVH